MLLKKVQILPITVPSNDSHATFDQGDMITNDKIYPSFKIVGKDEYLTPADGYKKVHLHVFANEKVSKGDFIFDSDSPLSIVRSKTYSTVEKNKLIATTDTTIPVSRLSKPFINSYIENPKTDAMVVCIEINNEIIVKRTSRGVITLRYDVKEAYSRADVFEKITQMLREVCNGCMKKGLEWMDENL